MKRQKIYLKMRDAWFYAQFLPEGLILNWFRRKILDNDLTLFTEIYVY